MSIFNSGSLVIHFIRKSKQYLTIARTNASQPRNETNFTPAGSKEVTMIHKDRANPVLEAAYAKDVGT